MIFANPNHLSEIKRFRLPMRIVSFIALGTLMVFTSCSSAKKTVTAIPHSPENELSQNTANVFQPFANTANNNYTPQPVMAALNNNSNLQENKADVATQPQIQTNNAENDFNKLSASFENKPSENIQSFAQVKQMAANKQINLTSKQLKRLDKLDAKYHGDFNKFQKDAGNIFDTQTSKIVAAVGVVGLLLLIISSSGFGAFLLILSVGALLLKWLGIVSF
jgi:hypothetical protein